MLFFSQNLITVHVFQFTFVQGKCFSFHFLHSSWIVEVVVDGYCDSQKIHVRHVELGTGQLFGECFARRPLSSVALVVLVFAVGQEFLLLLMPGLFQFLPETVTAFHQWVHQLAQVPWHLVEVDVIFSTGGWFWHDFAGKFNWHLLFFLLRALMCISFSLLIQTCDWTLSWCGKTQIQLDPGWWHM